ncbi:MAG: tagaturonate epimerase family protein [Nanoarchaeota archaeon]|nr:tagaturonate epimerase family protein [Nanoarchaeota archaeon]
MLELPKYSLGIGDRFGGQGFAQLEAIIRAKESGIIIAPVWNKSHREHGITGTEPGDVRYEAKESVRVKGWREPYFTDADHINLTNVRGFIPSSDFFTLDVADAIGTPSDEVSLDAFVERHSNLTKQDIELQIEGSTISFTEQDLREIGTKYLSAVNQVREIYEFIRTKKGEGTFITEVSMDETDTPQTPKELLVILAELAHQGVPVQTIAPKFTGDFFKGIDYVGDKTKFRQEFRQDLAVINYAIKHFGLPKNLKLSVHSGSDKFSLYPIMRTAMDEFDAGVHLKTAGTTWLEEVIGLAESDGEGLKIAKEIYRNSYKRIDELSEPYLSVIDIDKTSLPNPMDVDRWTSDQFTSALRHDQSNEGYNKDLRQLIHIGYKIAVEMGDRFYTALDDNKEVIAKNVTENLYGRHIKPLFLKEAA